MKKYILLLLLWLLASCEQSFHILSQEEISLESNFPHILVLPHHGLTGQKIDEFYQKLSEKNYKYDRIIVLSPDHFANISRPIESSPQWLQKACFLQKCVNILPLDVYSSWESRVFDKNYNTIEHWLWEHFIRINRHFWNTPVTPILLRRWAKLSYFDKKLAEKIVEIAKKEKVLLIASVDFSHHVDENFAIFHDAKSIRDLDSWDDIFGAEVDCKNCLWVAREVAHYFAQNRFHLFARTSVDSVSGVDSGYENTSHIFGYFSSESSLPKNSKKYIAFLLDAHFDSSVIYRLHQRGREDWDPKKYKHRITHGFDGVFVVWKEYKNAHKYQEFNVQKIPLEMRVFDTKIHWKYDNDLLLTMDSFSQKFALSQDNILVCELDEKSMQCHLVDIS